MTVKLSMDRSGMVYLPTGGSDLILILGCMTSNLFVLELLHFGFKCLWRTDTIVFSKLNKPPFSNKPQVSIKPPVKWAWNKSAPRRLNGGFTVIHSSLRYNTYISHVCNRKYSYLMSHKWRVIKSWSIRCHFIITAVAPLSLVRWTTIVTVRSLEKIKW